MIPAWLSFLVILILILAFSKKELSVVLTIGAIIFGLLTQVDLLGSIVLVAINPSIILLALSVTLIPILGGIMEESGLILELIEKLRVSKKMALILSPALFGLLPIPGGALMSAPIVDQIDPELDSNRKVGINVWYRHVLLLIYPISSAILVSSALSGISVYMIVVALIVPFSFMMLVGYFTLMRSVKSNEIIEKRDLKRVLHNAFPVMIAPIVDIIGRLFLPFPYPELYLFFGMCISIWVGLKLSKMTPIIIKDISKRMKIWRFPLLIFAMFLFLEIFIKSGVAEQFGSLNLPFYLFIFISFFLGFATGRVQLPMSILIPIYIIQNSVSLMPILDFTFIYFAVYLGYIITPMHPCLAYNINYFKTTYKQSFKFLAIPALICLGFLYCIYLLTIFI